MIVLRQKEYSLSAAKKAIVNELGEKGLKENLDWVERERNSIARFLKKNRGFDREGAIEEANRMKEEFAKNHEYGGIMSKRTALKSVNG